MSGTGSPRQGFRGAILAILVRYCNGSSAHGRALEFGKHQQVLPT